MFIERVETGIPGFDKLIEGGLVKGSTNLVAGNSGTGKTIFCMQYLWNGLQRGENGVYITLEQRPEDILSDVARFGWDFSKYITTGRFRLESLVASDIATVTKSIVENIKAVNAKRFALDSLTIATMGWKERPEEAFQLRGKAFDMLNTLKSLGVTSMIISEVPRSAKEEISRFGFEEFVVDSVILLNYMTIGGASRN
ncbi:MAG: ATPase domain-containing protein, partial [Candidatus Aenigmatarchaeota archaeon]